MGSGGEMTQPFAAQLLAAQPAMETAIQKCEKGNRSGLLVHCHRLRLPATGHWPPALSLGFQRFPRFPISQRETAGEATQPSSLQAVTQQPAEETRLPKTRKGKRPIRPRLQISLVPGRLCTNVLQS